MNKVIETERKSEARLIAARKGTEAEQIRARSEADSMRLKLETEERAAKLVADNPQLIRLRELEVLRETAHKGGNHFYLGMDRLISRPGGEGPA